MLPLFARCVRVVIPFIVMRSAGPALRVSNAIAVVMLFLTGYASERVTAYNPLSLGVRWSRSASH
jgi:hypothetical protein